MFRKMVLLLVLGTLDAVLGQGFDPQDSPLLSPCIDVVDEQQWASCWQSTGMRPVNPITPGVNGESVVQLSRFYEVRFKGFPNAMVPSSDAVEIHLGPYTVTPSRKISANSRKIDVYLNGALVPDRYFIMTAYPPNGNVDFMIDFVRNRVLRIWVPRL